MWRRRQRSLDEALALYRSYYEDPDSQEDLISVITDELNYVIKPDLTFTALVDRVNEGPSTGGSGSGVPRHRAK